MYAKMPMLPRMDKGVNVTTGFMRKIAQLFWNVWSVRITALRAQLLSVQDFLAKIVL
jgi:hypothetical protein